MSLNVLITGGTGFLAGELARSLLNDSEIGKIFLLVRPSDSESASQKFQRVIDHWNKFFPPLNENQNSRIEIVEFDLDSRSAFPDLGDVDYFIHSAANTDLGQALGEARICNVKTTQRAVEIARKMNGLKRFVFMSTAFVSGKKKGSITESTETVDFSNHYERSKYESEDCVKSSDLPYTILRPSIVVGRSDNGYFRKLKVLYSVWRIWLCGVLPRAPIDPKSKVDFVPVDYVTNATIALMKSKEALGEIYLLCAGDMCVSPYHVMVVAAESFKVKHPPLTRPWVAYLIGYWPFRKLFSQQVLDVLDTLFHHIHYLGARGRVFDTTRADTLLLKMGITRPHFRDYGNVMFGFCYKTKWGKKALQIDSV